MICQACGLDKKILVPKNEDFLAEDEGFEPPQTESESGVLPLHKSSMSRGQHGYYTQLSEKVKYFFRFFQTFFCGGIFPRRSRLFTRFPATDGPLQQYTAYFRSPPQSAALPWRYPYPPTPAHCGHGAWLHAPDRTLSWV